MLLSRAQDSRLSRVERIWENQTVVCVATGPSLTQAQVDACAGHPMIMVNDAYLMKDDADLCYWADRKWYEWQLKPERKEKWAAFKGLRCTLDVLNGRPPYPSEVHLLRNARRDGLSQDPDAICTGANSGYQAINIASLAGARRIILIGYDCKADGGKHHFFGDHPDKTMPPYAMIKQRFQQLAGVAENLKIEIVNATPGSALECFPRGDLASLLARP